MCDEFHTYGNNFLFKKKCCGKCKYGNRFPGCHIYCVNKNTKEYYVDTDYCCKYFEEKDEK